jgi:type II secretory pathway component GspD/PulD (secretin)
MLRKLIFGAVVIALFGAAGAVAFKVAKHKKLFQCCKQKRVSTPCAPKPINLPAAAEADEKKIDLSFEDASLTEVMKFLGEQGVNTVWAAKPEYKDLKVTAKMKQVSPLAAADAILESLGIAHKVMPEKILIVIGR